PAVSRGAARRRAWQVAGRSRVYLVDAAQVGVLECRRVLQPVPEEAVGPDMGEPDQRDLGEAAGAGYDSHRAECNRERLRVHRVIGDRPYLRAEGVAREGQIRGEDQRDEEDPPEVLVE